MTSADDARREAAFLYWRLSKNKQPQVPQELRIKINEYLNGGSA